MFSPHLYTHKFDIDDLIAALLDAREPTRHLNSHNGSIGPQPGPDPTHSFALQPLPPTWLAEQTAHDFYPRLPQPEQAELQTLIAQNPPLHTLIPLIQGSTALGGWLRERVKEAAMQWLADNDLIPPSMRHIAGTPQPRSVPAPGGVKKVSIT